MKTLSLICCAILVVAGIYCIVVRHDISGLPPVFIGSLAFLIIAPNIKKIAEHKATWMDK